MTLLLELLPSVIAKRVKRFGAYQRLGVGAAKSFFMSLGISSWSDFLGARMDLLPRGFALKSEVVVDVGANRGEWSCVALNVLEPRKLVAIEPNPSVYEVLSNKLEGYESAVCINEGVGAVPGLLPFHVTSGSQFASFLEPVASMRETYGDHFRKEKTIEVRVSTLDSILEQYETISLLKIDVQGYERCVLQGAAKILDRTEFILIEANFTQHYEHDIQFPELDMMLKLAGFELANMSPPFIKDGKVLWADALYRNRSLLRNSRK